MDGGAWERLAEGKLREVLKRWNAVSVRAFSRRFHAAQKPAELASVPFVAGETTVPYAGRVFTEDEVEALAAQGVAELRAAFDFMGHSRSYLFPMIDLPLTTVLEVAFSV